MQAKMLIIEQTGKLEQMNAKVGYKDHGGVGFTDEIEAVAIKLGEFPDGCAVCGNSEREDRKALLLYARCKDGEVLFDGLSEEEVEEA